MRPERWTGIHHRLLKKTAGWKDGKVHDVDRVRDISLEEFQREVLQAELAASATVESLCVFGYGLKAITAAKVEREAGQPAGRRGSR